MGGNLLTNVGDHDVGNRSVESNSVIDVEQAPTNILNSKIGTNKPYDTTPRLDPSI